MNLALCNAEAATLSYGRSVEPSDSSLRIVLLCTAIGAACSVLSCAMPMAENLVRYHALRYESEWLFHQLGQIACGVVTLGLLIAGSVRWLRRMGLRFGLSIVILALTAIELAFEIHGFSGQASSIETLISIAHSVGFALIGKIYLFVAWTALAKPRPDGNARVLRVTFGYCVLLGIIQSLIAARIVTFGVSDVRWIASYLLSLTQCITGTLASAICAIAMLCTPVRRFALVRIALAAFICGPVCCALHKLTSLQTRSGNGGAIAVDAGRYLLSEAGNAVPLIAFATMCCVAARCRARAGSAE